MLPPKFMSTHRILAVVFLLLVINEFFCAYKRYNEGTTLYKNALQRSKETNKKLIVIGNPTASWKNYLFGSSYGCGD